MPLTIRPIIFVLGRFSIIWLAELLSFMYVPVVTINCAYPSQQWPVDIFRLLKSQPSVLCQHGHLLDWFTGSLVLSGYSLLYSVANLPGLFAIYSYGILKSWVGWRYFGLCMLLYVVSRFESNLLPYGCRLFHVASLDGEPFVSTYERL
jgi:hypothetical protein